MKDLFESGFDGGLHALVRIVREAFAVDEERRRAVETEFAAVVNVALNFRGEFAAVERCVEARAIETKVSRILSELVNTELRLVTEKYTGVFPVLALFAC